MDDQRTTTRAEEQPNRTPVQPLPAPAPARRNGWMWVAVIGVIVAVALLATQLFLISELRSTNDELEAVRADLATVNASVGSVQDDVAAVADQVEELEQPALALAPTGASSAPEAPAAAPVEEPSAAPETAPGIVVTRGLPRFDGNPGTDPALGMQIGDVSGIEYYQGAETTFTPTPGVARAYFVWAHWCPYCQEEIPMITANLAAWQEQYPNVEIVSITTSIDEARGNPLYPYLDTGQFPFPVIIDDEGSISSHLGVSAFPFWVFVGPDGTVLARVAGLLGTEDLTNVFGQMSEIAAASA